MLFGHLTIPDRLKARVTRTLRSWGLLAALIFVVTARPAEAQCTSTVTPTTVSVSSVGSTSSLSVITGTNCTWTATSSVNWITVTSATGSGIGQVNYTVAANSSGSQRTGTMLVAGKTVTFTQSANSCVYTVTPTTVSVPSIGSTSALSVTSGTLCSWSATSSVSWITVTSATGSGIGQVNYTVAANSTGSARTGALLVAGQTVTFTQAANSCVYSVTPTSVSVPSIGSTSALSMTSGTACSWTAVSSVGWITITSGASGSGLGAINYVVAENTTGTARTGNITVGGVVVSFTQAANSCVYSVTPTSVSVPSIGSTSALSMTSGTACSWTAVSSVGWITITSGASGSGLGAINYVVAANTTGTARTGNITVGGVVVSFTQAANSCVYSVTPTSVSVPSIGSTSALSMTTGTACSWTAVSSVGWITITSGASGSGLGAINYVVAENTTGTARTGNITVGGVIVSFTQAANSCVYSVTPTSVSVPSIGSTSALSMTTGTACSWTAVSSVGWITITSGASGSGLGAINYVVAENTTGTARTGNITVGGVIVSFTQAANSCVYSVTPTSVSVPSIGSTSALSMTTGTACSWTAVSSVGWITITSGASGSGLGAINYVVAENTTGTARTGNITVGGVVVSFTQAANSCVYSVTPTSVSVPSIGSTSALSMTTGTACSWTAVSSVGWITITSGASGSGLGAINYVVAENTTGTARTGNITVGGVIVSFTQAANSCVYSVTPTSVSVPSIGSTSALSMTTGTACSWTAVSSVGWITITSGASGSGLGAINYVVAENTTGTARTGNITVGGVIVSFTQAANSCVYSVTPTSVSVPSIGSTSALSMTTGTACSWTAVSSVGWITITSGASGSGLGAINYVVAANTTTASRTGTIAVAGQTVTFTQAGNTCSYSVTPTSVSAQATGSPYTVTVTSGSGCSWSAATTASWIAITSGASGSGNGGVNFTVAVNTAATQRTGTLTVAGQTVTVTQAGATPPSAPTNFRIIR